MLLFLLGLLFLLLLLVLLTLALVLLLIASLSSTTLRLRLLNWGILGLCCGFLRCGSRFEIESEVWLGDFLAEDDCAEDASAWSHLKDEASVPAKVLKGVIARFLVEGQLEADRHS